MEYKLSTFQLSKLLEEAASLAALAALIRVGKLKPYLNKSQACRRFGRSFIENSLENGRISPIKDGQSSSSIRIDLLKVEMLKRAEELIIFF